MRIVETKEAMRALRSELAAEGGSVGFVPTMGALHAGHLSLVRAAAAVCDHVVTSVFVNPLQFAPGEDFERYPRDRAGDAAMLAEAGAGACFFARTDDMYPEGHCTYVVQEGPALGLETDARPTHFRGVLTVVLKLLLVVRPDQVFLGRKDYQQGVVVRRMVRDLEVDTRVVVCPTVRDADGLALSSRNAYLHPAQRAAGLAIPRAIARAQQAHAAGETDAGALEAIMRGVLQDAPGVHVEYATVRDRDSLASPEGPADEAVALVAARVGSTRLLDNGLLPAGEPDPRI
jgi:pantoate--beta-alanine ligase